MIPDTVEQELRLPKLGQIGYVVSDINETIAFCREAFGMSPWLLMDERPDPCIEKGEEIHPVLRIALAYAGSVQIELIQVVEGESFHLNHVREAREGAHHLGYMVNDLEKRLDICHDMGVGILQRGTIRESGFTIDYVYLDTVDRAGIVIELIGWRLGPVPIPVNRFVHNVVSTVGSWTLFRGRVIK